MAIDLKIPPSWMAEAKEAYEQYKAEWETEEAELAVLTGNDPEPPEPWEKFFAAYLYAELEAATYSDSGDVIPA